MNRHVVNPSRWMLSLLAFGGCAATVQLRESPVMPPDYSAAAFRPGCTVQLADGLHVESMAIVSEALQREDGSVVRPVAVSIDFMYGLGRVSALDMLQLPNVESDQAFTASLTVAPPNVCDPKLPDDMPVRNYQVDVKPRDSMQWADVRDSNDLVISVRGGSPFKPRDSSDVRHGARECAPVSQEADE